MTTGNEVDTRDTINIRRATEADARELAELGTATFVETFGHLYSPEDLGTYLAGTYSTTASERLLQEPGTAIWVAEGSDERLIAYSVAGACRLPVPNPERRAGELRRLYVRADSQKHRLGTRMLTLALDWLAEQGYGPLYVGVWSGNFGAQRLYGRFGFEKFGEYDYPVGKHVDREFILRLESWPPQRR